MKSNFPSRHVLTLALAALFAAAPALAQPGNGHGHDKGGKHADKHEEKAQKHGAKREREEIRHGSHFNDQHRHAARSYYVEHYGHNGRGCPPGLAKKNNGCLPPGQARKWDVGQPVPRGVTVYSVPQPVLVHLPPVPYGYRYSRIGSDVVLVRIQGNMIVDVMVNLFI